MTRAAHAEIISRIRSPHQLDMPRVLIATASSPAIAQALSDAGYVVSTTSGSADDVLSSLRNQRAVELLVLDGSEESWTVGSIIEAARAINRALPIILISPSDAELRAEARRLGVEAILDAPADAMEICHVARTIVPVVPEAELDLAG